jgi:hypothetical protein
MHAWGGVVGHDVAAPDREGVPMGDKSPKRANDKKQGKSLVEKRAAKRQKREQRRDDAQSRTQLDGH